MFGNQGNVSPLQEGKRKKILLAIFVIIIIIVTVVLVKYWPTGKKVSSDAPQGINQENPSQSVSNTNGALPGTEGVKPLTQEELDQQKKVMEDEVKSQSKGSAVPSATVTAPKSLTQEELDQQKKVMEDEVKSQSKGSAVPSATVTAPKPLTQEELDQQKKVKP